MNKAKAAGWRWPPHLHQRTVFCYFLWEICQITLQKIKIFCSMCEIWTSCLAQSRRGITNKVCCVAVPRGRNKRWRRERLEIRGNNQLETRRWWISADATGGRTGILLKQHGVGRLTNRNTWMHWDVNTTGGRSSTSWMKMVDRTICCKEIDVTDVRVHTELECLDSRKLLNCTAEWCNANIAWQFN